MCPPQWAGGPLLSHCAWRQHREPLDPVPNSCLGFAATGVAALMPTAMPRALGNPGGGGECRELPTPILPLLSPTWGEDTTSSGDHSYPQSAPALPQLPPSSAKPSLGSSLGTCWWMAQEVQLATTPSGYHPLSRNFSMQISVGVYFLLKARGQSMG